MSLDLEKLNETISEVEQALIKELYKLKKVSDDNLLEMAALPNGVCQAFGRNVKRMRAYLQASMAKDKLSLVDERHDELRIRIMLVDRLLNQDIPYAYLERALGDLIDSNQARGKLELNESTLLSVQDNESLWQRVWKFLLSLFNITPSSGISGHQFTVKERPSTQIERTVKNDLKRLLVLMKLIEVDQLHLLPDDKRPKDRMVTPEMMGQGILAKFFWIDLGESFYGEYLGSDPSVDGRSLTVNQIKDKIKANGGYVKGGKAIFAAQKLKNKVEQALEKETQNSALENIRKKASESSKKQTKSKANFKVQAKKKTVAENTEKKLIDPLFETKPVGKASFSPLSKEKVNSIGTIRKESKVRTPEEIRQKIELQAAPDTKLGKATFEPLQKKTRKHPKKVAVKKVIPKKESAPQGKAVFKPLSKAKPRGSV